MKIDGNRALPKHVPDWAHEPLEKLKEVTRGIEEGLPNDDFVAVPLNNDSAVLRAWGSRRRLSRLFSNDNSDGDQNPQKGILDRGWSQSYFQGNHDNGVITEVGRDDVEVTFLNGPTVTSFTVFQDGRAEIEFYNSVKPEESFDLENQLWREKHEERKVRSPHFEATHSASQFLDPSSEGKDLNGKASGLFLNQRHRLPQIRSEIFQSLEAELQTLPPEQQSELKAILSKPSVHTPKRLHKALLALQEKQNEKPSLLGGILNKALSLIGKKNEQPKQDYSVLKELAGNWQILEDTPKIMSDGLLRNQVFYVPPKTLELQAASQNWDFDKVTGLPIADSVVIGGGPGGLATGYHLSEEGKHTIIFEGGRVGQAFSDASAQAVHQLRTTQFTSNLIYTNKTIHTSPDVDLRLAGDAIAEKGHAARASWCEATGEVEHSGSQGRGPIERNNIFEHMVQIGHGLATSYPDTFVSENSPVSTLTKVERGDQTLFEVKTDKGHQVLARSLVLSTGFVGSDGEYARNLEQFAKLEEQAPNSVTVLANDHDVVAKNDQLEDKSQAMVFSDRLMGRPEVRERIKSLPKGARITVLGGGESAAKGAIEALMLNPDIKLDMYTLDPIEPYQVQIPVSHFSAGVAEHSLKNKDLAQKTLDQFQQLRTPISPFTMVSLLEFESEGRLSIKELGDFFGEKTVDLNLTNENGRSKFQFQVKDEKVAENLRHQRENWTASGLYGDKPPSEAPEVLADADMVMLAVGYNVGKAQASPLVQQLINQGLVEIKDGRVQYGDDGVTSALSSQIGFNTAAAPGMSSDTALRGRAVRGLRLADRLSEQTPSRRKHFDAKFARPRWDYVGQPQTINIQPLEEFEAQLNSELNGVSEQLLSAFDAQIDAVESEEEKNWLRQQRQLNLDYAGVNSSVRTIVGRYLDNPEALSPAERLTAERAMDITQRLRDS